MVAGLRFMLELLADPEVARVRHEIFIPNDEIVARLDAKSFPHLVAAFAVARLMDASVLRRTFMGKGILDIPRLSGNGDALRRLVRERSVAAYHVCGTCKMGTAEDPRAVVDPTGHVYGVDGLRVGDASIFPTIPCANTHLTVLMAAEKIADHSKAEWRRA